MKKMKGALFAAWVVLFLLSGCIPSKGHPRSAMFRANPQHTGVYETRGVHKASQLKWKFKMGKRVFSSPSVADSVVYFGSGDGNLYAVEIQTGRERWRVKTEGPVVNQRTERTDRGALLAAFKGRSVHQRKVAHFFS